MSKLTQFLYCQKRKFRRTTAYSSGEGRRRRRKKKKKKKKKKKEEEEEIEEEIEAELCHTFFGYNRISSRPKKNEDLSRMEK